ncbi:hypothetical protein [Bacillus sp. J33]|uniref:hypothetical protein n=1 Tax=Bacillus sp. J33 TaxID=935836 RepID=UPI0012FCD630|nr:hypothetical protein [Bacillus sp. J33]
MKFGNFENEYLTKPEYMKSYIKTDKFVNEVKEKYNIDLDELRSKLNVDVSPPEKKMTLSISGNDKAAIEEDLSLYTEAVLKASNEKYAMKLNIIESAIAELENTDSEFEKIDKVIEKFDLNYTIPTLEKTEIADNITVSEMPRVSPVQRAIVGFLAGVMLSLFILVLPEVFKD